METSKATAAGDGVDGAGWEFPQNPANLGRITMPLMASHTWVTEIKHIREGSFLCPRTGWAPYRFGYHYHVLRQENETVLLIDKVSSQPPFGVPGRLLHALSSSRRLEWAFTYRRERLHFSLSGTAQ